MEIRLLGPLEVHDGHRRPIPVTSPKQRIVLAALAVQPGQVVSLDRLVDCLWGDQPPATARDTVHSHVVRLRRNLHVDGVAPVRTQAPGYLLDLPPESVDLFQVDQARRRAAQSVVAGDDVAAVDLLTEALARWRGPMLSDVNSAVLRAETQPTWEEIRLQLIADRLDAALRLGRHNDHLAELRSLVLEHPLRERFRGQLMVALDAAGQRAAALEEFQEARRVLVAELGIEPGPQLHEVQQRILAGSSSPSVPDPTGPAELPHAVANFVGREDELARLDSVLARAATGPGWTPILVLEGPGGIGKTATALRWAHEHRGQFPDGQLYLDLQGFGPDNSPVPAAEALWHLLQSLGIPADQIPDGVAVRAARLRSRLSGKRVLLVLDNARHVDQVRPLLPGSATCFVIITSRVRMGGLIARDQAVTMRLDPLTTAESLRLLADRLGEDRVRAELAAAIELVNWCGNIPLALTIVAARALEDSHIALSELTDQLRHGRRLDAFDTEDSADGNLRTVYSWSYQALSANAATLFADLARHPGPNFSGEAAGAIAGLPYPEVQVHLAELTRTHLLDRLSAHRYRFHDLLRAYAHELPSRSDTAQAARRALDWYLHSAVNAGLTLRPHRAPVSLEELSPAVTPKSFGSYPEALAWCEEEHGNLMAAMRAAQAQGLPGHGWRIALALWSFYYITKRREDWLAASELGWRYAREAGDQLAEGAILASLGTALCESRRYDEALDRYAQALVHHRAVDDHDREASTLNSVAVVHGERGHFAEARAAFNEAREAYARVGNLQGEGLSLSNMALCFLELGEPEEAMAYNRKALAVYRELGDRYCEAICLANIAEVHVKAAEHRLAVEIFTEALTIHAEMGNRQGIARTSLGLGHSQSALGDDLAARASWQQAHEIFEDLGDPEADQTRELLGLRWPRDET
jgi:DNA-binding SARP family transcriptional activator/Tfp pilus assembly protein PilF